MRPTTEKKARERYERTLAKFCDLIPLETWVQTSYKELAETMGEPEGLVLRVKNVLGVVGALHTKYTGIRTEGDHNLHGRKAHYYRTKEIPQIKALMAEWKIGFLDEEYAAWKKPSTRPDRPSKPVIQQTSSDHPATIQPSSNGHPADIQRTSSRTEVPVIADEKDEGEVRAVAGPEATSPWEALRSVRRDESAALVEAARQYRGRAAFIDEELAKFEAMGIHVDRSAIKVDRDERLEAICLVLPEIDALAREARSYQEQIAKIRVDGQQLIDLRREIETEKRHITRLVAEKKELEARFTEESARRANIQNERIRELERQNEALSRRTQ